ncbi:hypothetical protein F5X99DRAFT_387298 [Biscogniauxia marginata]|nr:hypothetical protein F5X99DRAFT_387298 [Biscogniauxia marginata]
MYGAMHTAQPIVSGGKMLELDSIDQEKGSISPILMSELIPGVTLLEFLCRVEADPDKWLPIPNRLLWLIFQCLVRAVFGMANPPNRPYGEEQEEPTLEPLPAKEPTVNDYQIYHGDMHKNNWMFGDLDTGEHTLTPILKLIDFGLARDPSTFVNQSRTITQSNIYDIGRLMQSTCGPSDANSDTELEDLVFECCEPLAVNRPSLARLWRVIQNALNIKTGPQSFPGKPRAQWETDDMIRQYVQNFILNGDDVPVDTW